MTKKSYFLSADVSWVSLKISWQKVVFLSFKVMHYCSYLEWPLELASLWPSASKKQQNNPLWTMKAWILTVEVAFIITAIRKKTSRLLRSVGFIRWRPIIIVIYSIIYRVHTRCKFVFAPSIIIGRKLSNSITLWKSTSATIFRLFFHLEKQMIHLL